jgi:hypothetical protein
MIIEAQKGRSITARLMWVLAIFALYPIGTDGFDLQKHH